MDTQETSAQDNNKIHWHALSEAEIMEKLQTSIKGIKKEEASERLKEFGKNSLPPKKPVSLFEIFLHQFLSPLIYILLAAGVLSFITGDIKDAVVIFIVILLNSSLGTFQEFRAEKNAHALQNLIKTIAHVRRGGEEYEIDANELVPGDIVLLESGMKVPADIRVISSRNLQAEESLLTGESLPVEKDNVQTPEKASVTERKNIVFAGTTVTKGRCTGVVVSTGLHTQIGLIASSIVKTKTAKPPLIIRMEKFSRSISYIVLGACVLLAGIAITKEIPPIEIFFLTVALAVSAIPEGLPVAITVALSIATNRMAKRNVIVRKLAAVESLGSCTCIASDKTGTLTVNRQTVKTIWLPPRERIEVTGEGYNDNGRIISPTGKDISPESMNHLGLLSKMAVICNESELRFSKDEWEHRGDAIDIALLALSYKMKVDPHKAQSEITTLADIPFESELRYAAKFFRQGEHSGVAVKGAMETLLPLCTHMLSHKGQVKINAKEIEQAATAMAEEGYRVLAVAEGTIDKRNVDKLGSKKNLDSSDLPGLTFLGLIGLIDPLRTEAKEAVGTCRSAGVRVVMITGDHPETAFAIGRDLGIATSKNDVVTGKELDNIGNPDIPEYLEKVKNATIFARVTPFQKLQIVEALVKLGHFVAVTGDGANDAPALKKANVGVAMGSGTDIAKETASIIITNDNFVSIVAGIEEGRFAYSNVRKVTYLLISTGAAEILLFTIALLAGLPLPLLAVQLLWLNLVTNGIQDVALAFEGGEKGVMDIPPRRPNENIFNGQMLAQTLISGGIIGILAFGAWFAMTRNGYDEAYARNMLLLFMVIMENFHVFNCRSEKVSAFKIHIKNNRVLIFGVLGAQGIHIAAMNIPFMQNTLQVSPGNLTDWIMFAAIATTVLTVMEIFKVLNKRFRWFNHNVGTP